MGERKPQRKGMDKAMRKYQRLQSRGARGRTLRRLASRIVKLATDYDRRIKAWRVQQRALEAVVKVAAEQRAQQGTP